MENLSPNHDAAASSATPISVAPPVRAGTLALDENRQHKIRLQMFAQKSGIQLPTYQSSNLGSCHEPAFQTVVMVDGQTFKSSATFSHIKEAEQDAARVAYEGIQLKIRQERCPLLYEDVVFSKSILHEFAAQLGIPLPTYEVSKVDKPVPMFISTARFRGEKYVGIHARSKKEAEHMVARAAVESILGTSDAITMFQIVKAKSKLFAAMHGLNKSTHSQWEHGVTAPMIPQQTTLSLPFASEPVYHETNLTSGPRCNETGLEVVLLRQGPPSIIADIVDKLPTHVIGEHVAENSSKKRIGRRKKKAGNSMKKLRPNEGFVTALAT